MEPKLHYRLHVAPGTFPISAMMQGIDATQLPYLEGLERYTLCNFLDEAIFFHNFANRWIRKDGFRWLDRKTVDDASYSLRWSYHEAFKHLLHGLYLRSDLAKFYQLDKIPFLELDREGNRVPSQSVFKDPANKARFVARIFLSSSYRTSRFGDGPAPRGGYSGIHLDELAPRLRAGRTAVEDLVGLNAPPLPLDTALFAAFPDGTGPVVNYMALPHAFSGQAPPLPPSMPPISTAGGPTRLMWQPKLTEHLHIVLGSPLLGAEPRGDRVVLPALRRKTRLPRIRHVQQLVDAVERSLAALPVSALPKALRKAIQPFHDWESQLSVLESLFGAAAEAAEAGSIAHKRFVIEWAVVLIYLLRWYLVDVKARILMTALPIYHLYDGSWWKGAGGSNAYLGLALNEALSGAPLPHPTVPSVLDADFPVGEGFEFSDADAKAQYESKGFVIQRERLAGDPSALGDWAELAESSPFCDPADAYLRDFSRYPILIDFRETPEPAAPGVAFEAEERPQGRRPPPDEDREYVHVMATPDPRWISHRTPLIQHAAKDAPNDRPDFYRITGALRNPAVSQLNMAARFQVQLHLYVACAILDRLARVTPLRDVYERQVGKLKGTPASELFDLEEGHDLDINRECGKYARFLVERHDAKRRWARLNFVLTAGSYAFGGSFPPHMTHKTGDCFDLGMGPDLTPWPVYRVRSFLGAAYRVLDVVGTMSREEMLLADIRGKQIAGAVALYEIHQTPKNWCSRGPLVAHTEARSLKNEVFKHLHGHADADFFAAREKELAGTPHFVAKEDGELAHVGHVALLAAAAQQIVYASPIIHLRAMQAINALALRIDDAEGEPVAAPGFARPGTLQATAYALTRNCEFAFKPADHHHHWHVVFPENGLSRGRNLWLRLGIDLDPFLDYLKAHREGGHIARSAGSKQAGEDFDEALKFCEEYRDDFLRLHPAGPSKESDDYVIELFRNFIVSVEGYTGEWLEPAAPVRTISARLLRHSKARRDHITVVLNRVLRDQDRAFVLRVAQQMEDETPEHFAERRRVLRAIRNGDRKTLLETMNEVFSYDELMEQYARIGEEAEPAEPEP